MELETYRGKPIDTLSREELIDLVKMLGKEVMELRSRPIDYKKMVHNTLYGEQNGNKA